MRMTRNYRPLVDGRMKGRWAVGGGEEMAAVGDAQSDATTSPHEGEGTNYS